MEKVDNLTCDLDSFTDEFKLNVDEHVNDIIYDLKKGSKKFSDNLANSALKIANILKSFENYETDTIKHEIDNNAEVIGTNGLSVLNSKTSESGVDIAEFGSIYLRIKDVIDKLATEFNDFSIKLDSLTEDNKKIESTEIARVPLPTKVNGVRMSSDSFMDVLRFFPVPVDKDRKYEIKLRRNLILSHYENITAIRFLEELKQLPFDHELEELITNSEIRVNNAKNILLNHIRELVTFNESYREFINEYMIALDSAPEPAHKSPEYIKKFEKMVKRQLKTDKIVIKSKQDNELIKGSIIDFENILKDFVKGIRKVVSKS